MKQITITVEDEQMETVYSLLKDMNIVSIERDDIEIPEWQQHIILERKNEMENNPNEYSTLEQIRSILNGK